MITFAGVGKTYPGAARPAVIDVTLEVPTGGVCVLLGPSGCGKSTLLRMVNRLVEPDTGAVALDGRDVRSWPLEALRRGIGYAIQGVGLFPHWTVAENVACVPRLLGWPPRRVADRVAEMLALVGLPVERYGCVYPDALSGGEAQRVGVARALAADPPVLLMDEPFGAVDPLTRGHLQAEFAAIQRRLKKTVLLVTHDLDEAVRLGDRIALLNAGRLVQHDPPERLLAAPRDAFVAEFVGSERALKRLALAPVSAELGPIGEGMGGGDLGHDLDHDHDVAGTTAAAAATVPASASLREALARLLDTGRPVVDVVDDAGTVIGTVGWTQIARHCRRPPP